jgi:hypothetical protein
MIILFVFIVESRRIQRREASCPENAELQVAREKIILSG